MRNARAEPFRQPEIGGVLQQQKWRNCIPRIQRFAGLAARPKDSLHSAFINLIYSICECRHSSRGDNAAEQHFFVVLSLPVAGVKSMMMSTDIIAYHRAEIVPTHSTRTGILISSLTFAGKTIQTRSESSLMGGNGIRTFLTDFSALFPLPLFATSCSGRSDFRGIRNSYEMDEMRETKNGKNISNASGATTFACHAECRTFRIFANVSMSAFTLGGFHRSDEIGRARIMR